MEALTDFFEQEIVAEMERIDSLGGILKCVEEGTIQKLIIDEIVLFIQKETSRRAEP